MFKMRILSVLFLVFTMNLVSAQILINEDFNTGTPMGWTGPYLNTFMGACEGNALRANVWLNTPSASLTSPNQVGASNGTDLEVSFDYKIVELSSTTIAQGLAWGIAELQYSTNDGANWQTILTIDDSNHITSSSCATMLATIPAEVLPMGADVKLRISVTWSSGDYYFYIDNFNAMQESLSLPNCDANLLQTTDVNVLGELVWSAATAFPSGYYITIGTNAGESDVLPLTDVGNVTMYSLADLNLEQGATYYTTIIPYNSNGNASGCVEQMFTSAVSPANDICANAEVVEIGTITVGTTIGATGMSDISCNGSIGDDVWYTLVGDGGVLTLTLDAVDEYFQIGVFESIDCSDIVLGECDYSIDPLSHPASLTFPSIAGATYYIQLGAWSQGGNPSVFEFSVTSAPANDECWGAETVSLGVTTTANNTGATISAELPDCDNIIREADVWYTFNSGTSSLINVITDAGYFVQVWEGYCGALFPLTDACAATRIEDLEVLEHTVYYVQLWSNRSIGTGEFNLTIGDATNINATNEVIEGLAVYPNPVDDQLFFNAQDYIESIRVYNALGQELLFSMPNTVQTYVNTSALKAGMYMVKVKIGSDSGTYVFIKK